MKKAFSKLVFLLLYLLSAMLFVAWKWSCFFSPYESLAIVLSVLLFLVFGHTLLLNLAISLVKWRDAGTGSRRRILAFLLGCVMAVSMYRLDAALRQWPFADPVQEYDITGEWLHGTLVLYDDHHFQMNYTILFSRYHQFGTYAQVDGILRLHPSNADCELWEYLPKETSPTHDLSLNTPACNQSRLPHSLSPR